MRGGHEEGRCRLSQGGFGRAEVPGRPERQRTQGRKARLRRAGPRDGRLQQVVQVGGRAAGCDPGGRGGRRSRDLRHVVRGGVLRPLRERASARMKRFAAASASRRGAHPKRKGPVLAQPSLELCNGSTAFVFSATLAGTALVDVTRAEPLRSSSAAPARERPVALNHARAAPNGPTRRSC